MRRHTIGLAPLWLPACALMEVTQFRLNDARVTARKPAHARKAVPLAVTFCGALTTSNTANCAAVLELNGGPDQRI